MASTKDVKYVRVTIRLGRTQSFEISADERVRVNPNEAEFDAASINGSPDELALQLLTKLLAAFKSSAEDIKLTVEGTRIQLDPVTPTNRGSGTVLGGSS